MGETELLSSLKEISLKRGKEKKKKLFFLFLPLKLSIPNQAATLLHWSITKWIRTDKLIKSGQWVHFVYTLYPVRIFLRFRLKSSSSCNSFQADRSLWSCAMQSFRPGRCCKRALPLCCSDMYTSHVHTFKIPSKVYLLQFNNVQHLNFGQPFLLPMFYHDFKSFVSEERN